MSIHHLFHAEEIGASKEPNLDRLVKVFMQKPLVETLSSRHIGVVNEEYAVSFDGMKMFGVLDLETQMEGCRFSIGIRNSHDKSIRLGLTSGLRVFVCSNMAFSGELTPGTM